MAPEDFGERNELYTHSNGVSVGCIACLLHFHDLRMMPQVVEILRLTILRQHCKLQRNGRVQLCENW